jgi:outer membrane protein
MTKIKVVVLAALVSMLAITGAKAQTSFKKDDKIVEGTVSFTKETAEDAEYSFSPSVGYFLTDRFAAGVALDLGENQAGQVTNFGAFGRCYFLAVGKNLNLYSQLTVGSNSSKVAGVKTSQFATSVGLGANYFLTKRVAVSAHLADLASYTSQDGVSTFNVGFVGFDNPIIATKFGILVKF